MDEMGHTFRNSGEELTDYYCYNKPVLAPADGWIEDFTDGIEDNPIGEVNLEQNWGNTLVIRHADHLYSSVSHLKKDSIKVSRGDFVKKGDIIAFCGSSGRSPVPHLHFQFSRPAIGSALIAAFARYPKSSRILFFAFRLSFDVQRSAISRIMICCINPSIYTRPELIFQI
jgi:murein DD-endopeptidase MepM/ murein hydrolase activator NlpD